MDIPTFIYRASDPSDAPEIARLLRMASGGIVDFLFPASDTELTVEGSLATFLRSETGILSYRNVEVACWNDQIVGMVHSYAAAQHRMTEEMKGTLPKNRLEVLKAFYKTPIKNSWFLNALAVKSPYRKQGIGTSLLWRTKQKAWESGCTLLSTIAWSDNRAALRLYQKNGFREVKQIPVLQHPELSHCGSCVLMSCRILI